MWRLRAAIVDTRTVPLGIWGTMLAVVLWLGMFLLLYFHPLKQLPSIEDYRSQLFFTGVLTLIPTAAVFLYSYLVLTPRRLAREQAAKHEASRFGSSHKDQVTGILRNALSERRLSISNAFLFGSMTHEGRAPADIDIAVCISGNEKQVRKTIRLLKGLVNPLLMPYQLPIHWQLFLSTEGEELKSFLKKAGSYEEIM